MISSCSAKPGSACNDLSLFLGSGSSVCQSAKLPGFVGFTKESRRSASAILAEGLKLAFNDTLGSIEPEHSGSDFVLQRHWLDHWSVQLEVLVPYVLAPRRSKTAEVVQESTSTWKYPGRRAVDQNRTGRRFYLRPASKADLITLSNASPLEVFGSTAKAPCFCAIYRDSPSCAVTIMIGNE